MALSLSGIHPDTFKSQVNEQLSSQAAPNREETPARYVLGVKVAADQQSTAAHVAGNTSWEGILASLTTIMFWLRGWVGRDSTVVDKTTQDKLPEVTGDETVEPENQGLSGLSSKRNGEKPTDIVNAFTATERAFGEFFDVSSHAAVIKMMMLRFGQSPFDVFDQVRPTADGYEITMKDGFDVRVTHEELKFAAQASRFTGEDAGAVKDANFLLAAYVKRKQIESGASFSAALEKTTHGETTHRLLKGMGMIGYMRQVPSSELVGTKAVGVMRTHDFGASLVLDGVKYNYQKREALDDTYGYKLAGDETLADELLVNPGADTLQISSVPVGVKPVDIWSGFYQGMEGNCVTVSAIKAAMVKLGQNPAGIYRRIGATGDGYEVVMRDGFKLHLTHQELKKAEHGSNLKGADTRLVKDANFLYAVSAKRAQLENHEFRAAQSFEVAMETLNDGEMPGDAFRRLGLYAYTRPSTAQELAAGALGTLANYQHSVVVINGAMDFYGFKSPLASSSWDRNDGVAIKLV